MSSCPLVVLKSTGVESTPGSEVFMAVVDLESFESPITGLFALA
eukprot:CAMPEP_0194758418 /NCGR_PEP_ID=MMETSP0323_2-20130528/11697_1 /TAXON_ID=2866 ORGANISM="Crypthecodinium cohnii, Strain Seligo" /NCGR_SAMPLE_ID=MMETSP0323_2 /ASSEMBLY_ACC=CAM_ASM_000346 /LENGTH=43 /DNA_ID= /DNA_START= /DNA_END= /DNA_ORIENTATION=